MVGAWAWSEPAADLDTITVSGTGTEKRLKDSPVQTEVITGEELAASGATTLAEALSAYGVDHTAQAGHGDYIQLQGLGESRVLILIDGRRLIGRTAERIDAQTLSLDNIDHIEIIRGPQSTLYGSDAMGGVINIITKKPSAKLTGSAALTNTLVPPYDDPTTAKTAAAWNIFNLVNRQTFTGTLNFPLGPVKTALSVSASRGSTLLDEAQNLSVAPGFAQARVGIDAGVPVSDRFDLRFGVSGQLNGKQSQTDFTGSAQRQDIVRAEGYVDGSARPDDHLKLQFKVYNNFYQRDQSVYNGITATWLRGNEYEFENLIGGQVTGSIDLADWNLLSLGAEGSLDLMKKYNLAGGNQIFSADREAIFAQDEFFEENHYSVVIGARLEHSSQFGFFPAPKIAAMFYLAPEFRLLAGFGVGYRAPSFSDLYLNMDISGHPVVLGNTALTPEYNLGGNLGFEWALKSFTTRFQIFHQELFNEIIYVQQGFVADGRALYQNQNTQRSSRTGGDTELKVKFLESFSIDASYGLVYAFNRSANQVLYIQPQHTVKAGLGFDPKDLGLHINFGGIWYSPLDPTSKTDEARLILHVYAAKDLGENFQVYLNVDNLTGYINKAVGPYVAQQFSLGLRTKF